MEVHQEQLRGVGIRQEAGVDLQPQLGDLLGQGPGVGECDPASFFSRLIRSTRACSRALKWVRRGIGRGGRWSQGAESPNQMSNGLNFGPGSRVRGTITSSSLRDSTAIRLSRRRNSFKIVDGHGRRWPIVSQHVLHPTFAHGRTNFASRQGLTAATSRRFAFNSLDKCCNRKGSRAAGCGRAGPVDRSGRSTETSG